MIVLVVGMAGLAQTCLSILAALLLYVRGETLRAGAFVVSGFFLLPLVFGFWMSIMGGMLWVTGILTVLVTYAAFSTWLAEPSGMPWATAGFVLVATPLSITGLIGGFGVFHGGPNTLSDVSAFMAIVALFGGSIWCLLGPAALGVLRGLVDRQRHRASEAR